MNDTPNGSMQYGQWEARILTKSRVLLTATWHARGFALCRSLAILRGISSRQEPSSVNRPVSVKPDNFFLLLFRALRQRRVPLTLRIASHSLLLVALALLIYAWVIGMQFKQAMHQQAEALGSSLITQTAASATELLVSNDILSLNVLLNNLVKNPLVAHAAIYSVDNRTLAEAGTRPSKNILGETEGLFSTPITFQEVMAGQLRISLNMQQFQQPMTISLQSMAILSLILLALALSLSLRLGRHISTPLLQLRVWLRDPDVTAPGAERQDEIGELARQLQSRLAPAASLAASHAARELSGDHEPPRNAPAREDEEDEPDALFATRDLRDASFHGDDYDPPSRADDPVSGLQRDQQPPAETMGGLSAVLAIQLGAQEQLRRLPRARLLELLQRYRDCLSQAADRYNARLHTLNDGSSLMLFHQEDSQDDYLTHAVCCGELLRALAHELQIEVADSGITLHLQLGLSLGQQLGELSQGDLLLSDTAQEALALSQHSRNLLLINRHVSEDARLRQCARIRNIASPEGASCVERLLEPYPAQIERQLLGMRESH
jgi:uncharacterized membrane protein affecting hemolysin expression